jgi:hypothetical protein
MGSGPDMVRLDFQTSPDYTWSYRVNVIRLDTMAPTQHDAPARKGNVFSTDEDPI